MDGTGYFQVFQLPWSSNFTVPSTEINKKLANAFSEYIYAASAQYMQKLKRVISSWKKQSGFIA